MTSVYERQIAWNAPGSDFVAINVDGSVFTDLGAAGFGGLLRDHLGTFLYGFYGSIGVSCIMHAEIMGIFYGLQLCWSKGYRRVICYSDSANAIELAKGDLKVHRRYGNVIAAIKRMMRKDCECELIHTLREGNFSTDFLAKMGARSATSFIVVHEPPLDMASILLADAMGVPFIRH